MNLLLDPVLRGRELKKARTAGGGRWRRPAVTNGIPVPAISQPRWRTTTATAPAACRRTCLQAQRDYFGAHTYERTDKPRGEFFHTNWTGRGGRGRGRPPASGTASGIARQELTVRRPRPAPSGWRTSAPAPMADGDGQGADQRRHGGHHDRAEADQAGLEDGVAAAIPSLRCCARAKSIIMMAFFLTMPISMMTPTKA
jgi:hypothetical protein